MSGTSAQKGELKLRLQLRLDQQAQEQHARQWEEQLQGHRTRK